MKTKIDKTTAQNLIVSMYLCGIVSSKQSNPLWWNF